MPSPTNILPDVLSGILNSVPTVSSAPVVTLALNEALPASDISKVSAVIAEPPSLPLNIISLSEVVDFITKSVDELVNSPKVVPPSLRNTSPPSASRMMSPATSTVKSPELKSISVPSIVMSSTLTPPFAVRLVAFKVVNVPVPAVVPPMVTLSIVPLSIFALVTSIDARTSCSIALLSSALVIFFVTLVLESTTKKTSSVAVSEPVMAVMSEIFCTGIN